MASSHGDISFTSLSAWLISPKSAHSLGFSFGGRLDALALRLGLVGVVPHARIKQMDHCLAQLWRQLRPIGQSEYSLVQAANLQAAKHLEVEKVASYLERP